MVTPLSRAERFTEKLYDGDRVEGLHEGPACTSTFS